MENILKQIETPYVDAQTLLNLLSNYRKPREKIIHLVKKGELIRLKNGFYLITDKIEQGTNRIIPFEQIANMLYGPSYVSLEWALSFYGMIPERVHSVTSMTLGKNKEYRTPIGYFSYHRLTPTSYPTGITQKKTTHFPGNFIIATPEKALTDLVFLKCKGLDRDQLKADLLESKRIDRTCIQQLDKTLLFEIAKQFRSKSVGHLLELVGSL
jgi:predicted transcriptional regulator of viral defense system